MQARTLPVRVSRWSQGRTVASVSAMSTTAAARRPSSLPLAAALAAALVVAAILPLLAVRAATGDPVLINEVLISHTGFPDDTEFLELYGLPGASLSGLSLLVVEGDSSGAPGTVDRRIDFADDARLGGNGFYLVGNPAGLAAHYEVAPDLAIGDDSFENGSQTLAVVSTASVGAGPSVTGDEAVLDSVALTDAGPTDAWFFGAPVVGPDDGFLPGGARRVTDGVDTDAIADWAFADDQLGAANTPTAATPILEPTPSSSPTPAPDDMTAMVNALVASGAIAPTKAQLVMDRLDRMAEFADRGKEAAARAQLRAFENQVRGLSPRWITPDAADALIATAKELFGG